MTRFLLDTNVPSEIFRPRPDPNVVHWLESAPREMLFLSVLTLGELRRGLSLLQEKSARRIKLESAIEQSIPSWFADRILPITRSIAEYWGELDATRQLAGHPLATADGLIAATALHHNLTVVTRNTKDFADLGVPLLNPWEANQP